MHTMHFFGCHYKVTINIKWFFIGYTPLHSTCKSGYKTFLLKISQQELVLTIFISISSIIVLPSFVSSLLSSIAVIHISTKNVRSTNFLSTSCSLSYLDKNNDEVFQLQLQGIYFLIKNKNSLRKRRKRGAIYICF